MTWAELKKHIEDAGVTDDMTLWYIDISFDQKLYIYPQGVKYPNDIGFSVSN